MNNKGQHQETPMTLLLTLMCADRKLRRLEQAADKMQQEHVAHAAACLERELSRNGDDLLKATVAVLHRGCREAGTSPLHQCKVTPEFEKQMLETWTKQQQDPSAQERVSAGDFDYNVAWAETRRCKREIDEALDERNKAAYRLVQKFFARAHFKRCMLGPEHLDPAERLLCDFQSVSDLRISSDTGRLFGHVAMWLRTRTPGRCRGCGKRGCEHRKGAVRCRQCGMACYCSIQCEIADGANQIFSHSHECGLLPPECT